MSEYDLFQLKGYSIDFKYSLFIQVLNVSKFYNESFIELYERTQYRNVYRMECLMNYIIKKQNKQGK